MKKKVEDIVSWKRNEVIFINIKNITHAFTLHLHDQMTAAGVFLHIQSYYLIVQVTLAAQFVQIRPIQLITDISNHQLFLPPSV